MDIYEIIKFNWIPVSVALYGTRRNYSPRNIQTYNPLSCTILVELYAYHKNSDHKVRYMIDKIILHKQCPVFYFLLLAFTNIFICNRSTQDIFFYKEERKEEYSLNDLQKVTKRKDNRRFFTLPFIIPS